MEKVHHSDPVGAVRHPVRLHVDHNLLRRMSKLKVVFLVRTDPVVGDDDHVRRLLCQSLHYEESLGRQQLKHLEKHRRMAVM